MGTLASLKESDPELYSYIKKELKRQRETIELIPSENFASPAVIGTLGTVLTNKYSEGYPGRRYYAGNAQIDSIESLAAERAKALFGVPHANVQPYSGSPANTAVYFALCRPGDAIMGLDLTHGGHLTHGWKSSFSGSFFRSVPYHVKADGYIDIEEVRRLAMENKPRLIWIGATAYTRALPFSEFSRIAKESGAYLVADISHIAGLVAGGQHESPAEYADIIVTTTHKTLRGPRGAMIMATRKGLAKDPALAEKIDKSIFPGLQGGPHDNVTAAIAAALLEASRPEFREYAKQVVANARALADTLVRQGFRLVTGGTDNHMILVDLTQSGKGMGAFAQEALDAARIVVNKNTVPGEPSSPFYPSGIRLGTPAITTRGMKEGQMAVLGRIMADVLERISGSSLPEQKELRAEYVRGFRRRMARDPVIKKAGREALALCKEFPLYGDIRL